MPRRKMMGHLKETWNTARGRIVLRILWEKMKAYDFYIRECAEIVIADAHYAGNAMRASIER